MSYDKKYTNDQYEKWLNGDRKLIGNVGLAHLSILDSYKRWITPSRYSIDYKKWENPFAIEIIQWTATAINIKLWNKYINPSNKYQFHLWMPDICMQFLKLNIYNVVLPNLFMLSMQEIKAKYNIPVNSANGSKNGDEYHFGNYNKAHIHWRNKWGWEYDHTSTTLIDKLIESKYKGTLIEKFYKYDGELPIKNFGF